MCLFLRACLCVFSRKRIQKIARRRSTPRKTPERHTAPAEGLKNYPGDQSAQAINTSQKSYLRSTRFFFFMLSCSIRRMYSTETTLNLNNGPCSLIFSPVSRHYFQLSKWHHLAFCLVAGNHTSTKKHTHHTHTHNTAH